MPSKRPYPPEHYPPSYFEAVKKAVGQHDVRFIAASAVDSKEAARFHTKLKAMLKHVETFAGQDPKIVEAVREGRLHLKKIWEPKEKRVHLTVCMYSRPSELGNAYMAEMIQKQRSGLI